MKFKLEANCIVEATDLTHASNKLRMYFAQLGAEHAGIGAGPEVRLPIKLIPIPEIGESKQSEDKKRT